MLGVEEFLAEMRKVTEELFRVLKRGKMCVVTIGDVRKYGNRKHCNVYLTSCCKRI